MRIDSTKRSLSDAPTAGGTAPLSFVALGVFWTLLVAGSLAWNLRHEYAAVMARAYAEARTNYNKDKTLRRWVNSHGGVYVPLTDEQQPVPWLADLPARDVVTDKGQNLTLLNPASVLRQMMQRYEHDYGIRGRITGLRYLNPANAPDAWERIQLEAFTRGERDEVWEIAELNGQPQLRYLHAMYMEPGCEKCHAVLGYKTGDMRGATGVNLPLAPYYQTLNQATRILGGSHAAIWVAGLIGLLFAYRKQNEQTARAQAAYRSLAESEARHRLIIESAAEGFWMIGVDQRTLYVNSTLCQILGYTSMEMQGRHPIEFSDEENAAIFRAQLASVATTDHRYYEIALRHKDGHNIPLEFHATTHFDDEGNPALAFAFISDLSARKALERELAQHQANLETMVAARTADLEAARNEAERLARVKSEFLANMSHEIRTPLNAVLGFARIGMRENQGRKSGQTCQRILDAGEHLLGVIDDILVFSRIEAGKFELESLPFQLEAVIANAASFVAGTAQYKGLAYSLEQAPDLPAWVTGDPQRLQQILVNLLSNAVKFTERGEVRLKVGRAADQIYFKVIDTGIGMTAEDMNRLFSPFEQADSSTTRRYGGSGLGLAISRDLAHLMNGEISVESAPGAGASFMLQIPLTEVAAPTRITNGATTEVGARLTGIRVLAAEDVEVNRLILEDMLVHEGADVVFACDGREALVCVQDRGADAFDVVLMDIQMPVMDGYEAARRLREIAPGLPVIGLTAHAMAEERRRCLDAGMVAHVTKPIDVDGLVEAMIEHIGRPAPQVSSDGEHALGEESMGDTVADGPVDLVDWAGLLNRFKGRRAFVGKLLTALLASHADTPAKLRAATLAPDLEALVFMAHSIKGVAGNLMAPDLQEQARQTEVSARAGLPEAGELATALADSLDRLLAEAVARSSEFKPA